MRYNLLFLFILLNLSSVAQDEYKTVFSDDFNNNRSYWTINNSRLRQSQISNGKLVDWSGEKGFSYANVISPNFNKSNDYTIKFSISNLNNLKGYKYKVYTKKSNGKLKESWNDNPVWGFVWGFKDWNNYNAIYLVNSKRSEYSSEETHYKVISMVGGSEIIHSDWYSPTIGLNDFTGINEFTIEKTGNDFRICTQNGFEQYLCRFSGTQWSGAYLGIYIGAGAKVVIDYLKIETPTPCKNAKYLISQADKFVEQQYYANAIKKYSEAIKIGCVSSELYLKRANANYSREFYASAKDDCSKAISMTSQNENAYYLRGLCKMYLKDETAIDDLKKGGDEGKMLVKELESQYNTSTTTSGSTQPVNATGSGLIISKDGYIVTNEHVVNGGKYITVQVLKNGKKHEYNAKVIKLDKANDLAILRIDDSSFKYYLNIPFGIRAYGVRVGEAVFSMGYPQISLQGDEIKVTDGIISSKTGFQNDVTTYQISAPIQPGNSGGPLFDKKGNLIGITNAGIPDSENVGYAIKSSYLMNMLEVFNDINLSYSNSINNLSFPDLIEKLTNYVVLIKVSTNPTKTISSTPNNITSVIGGGYTSTPLTDYIWDYVKKEYVKSEQYEYTSQLYFKPDLVCFKRGSNKWLMSKWSYEGYNADDNYHYYYDNYGQQILINKELTKVIWYYERDGEIFKKCSIYSNLTKDDNVTPYNKNGKSNKNTADIESALNKLQNNQINSAYQDFNTLIEKDPNNPILYFYRGNILLYEIHNFDLAISDFNKCIQLNPENENAYFYLGLCYQELKKYPEAIREFTKCVTISPNVDALFMRALAKSELNDKQGAISDYKKIIGLKDSTTPQFFKMSTVYNNMAYTLVGLEKYNDALSLVNKALDLDKSEAYIWDTRGEIYFHLGKYTKCINDMDTSIKLEPSGNSYYIRGLSKIKLNDSSEGCKDLSKAGELGKLEAYEAISKYCK